MVSKFSQRQAKERTTASYFKRLFMGFMLVALLVSACQPIQAPAPEQSLSPPDENQRLPSERRPDAPPYAVRGSFAVGYRQLVSDAGTERPLEVSIWYPALNPTGTQEAIQYVAQLKDATWSPDTSPVVYGRALRDAGFDESQGPYPLVIFSHSFSGSAAGHSATAEHYASYGFIVLAPEHVEQFDLAFGDLWKALIDRPRDMIRTLDYAEQLTAPDGDLAGLIDMEQVAVVGHSYGGYTALAMAGAQYDLAAYHARCAQIPAEDPLSFFCMVTSKEVEMAARAGLDPLPEGLWPSFGDPRVKAIIPMAGDAYLFDRAGLSKITVPVMAMGGSADTGTPYEWGPKPTYDFVASEQKALVTFMGAEHMIFTTPCERQPWMRDHPAYAYFCFDPVWDRARALDLIHHFSTAFLLDTLKGDQAGHAALLPDAVQFPGVEYTTTLN